MAHCRLPLTCWHPTIGRVQCKQSTVQRLDHIHCFGMYSQIVINCVFSRTVMLEVEKDVDGDDLGFMLMCLFVFVVSGDDAESRSVTANNCNLVPQVFQHTSPATVAFQNNGFATQRLFTYHLVCNNKCCFINNFQTSSH